MINCIAMGASIPTISSLKQSKLKSRSTARTTFCEYWFATDSLTKRFEHWPQAFTAINESKRFVLSISSLVRSCTNSGQDLQKAPNLLNRWFNEFGIEEAWCGNITYIQTAKGLLYLVSIIDWGTCSVVCYEFGERMTKKLVINALKRTYDNKQPSSLHLSSWARLPVLQSSLLRKASRISVMKFNESLSSILR